MTKFWGLCVLKAGAGCFEEKRNLLCRLQHEIGAPGRDSVEVTGTANESWELHKIPLLCRCDRRLQSSLGKQGGGIRTPDSLENLCACLKLCLFLARCMDRRSTPRVSQ